ncbi:hypothetical protein Tco_1209081, partial [Tanacetum coccineum]
LQRSIQFIRTFKWYQSWTSAKSKTINNVRHITAKVGGKFVSISEASIRTDLIFDDADRIDSLPNQAIFNAIKLMGYEGDLNVLTFNKALFSSQWRFLFHTINHCLSSKSTSWDQIPTNIATAVICLTTNQKYNFSKLIFDGMLRHLEAKKKFVMYPRFISIFLGRQLANISVPLDHFPINSLTSKVFSFMVKKSKRFSGKVTPLFGTMLIQPTQAEGASSERLSAEQSSPSPAPTSEIPYEPQSDSSSAQPSENFTKTFTQTFTKNVSKQGRKIAKGESSVQRDPMFDVMPEDNIDHMETGNAQSEGRTKEMVDEDKEIDEDGVSTVKEGVNTDFEKVCTDFEKVSTDKPLVSTDGSKVSTDEQIEGADDQVEGTEKNNEGNEEIFESTAGQREGTEDQSKEEIATPASQTSTQT